LLHDLHLPHSAPLGDRPGAGLEASGVARRDDLLQGIEPLGEVNTEVFCPRELFRAIPNERLDAFTERRSLDQGLLIGFEAVRLARQDVRAGAGLGVFQQRAQPVELPDDVAGVLDPAPRLDHAADVSVGDDHESSEHQPCQRDSGARPNPSGESHPGRA
jgi:hypothetical protein